MSMLQILFLSAPFVIAVLLAAALVAGPFAMQAGLRHWSDTRRAISVFWLISISAVLNIVLVPRNLFLSENAPALDFSAYSASVVQASWLSRLFTIALVGFSLAILFSSWLSAKPEKNRNQAVYWLAVMLALYYLMGILTGITVASEPSFNHKALYIPIVLGALVSLRHVEFGKLVVHLKAILFTVMLMSVAAAFVSPDFALLRPYATGQLPGIDFRLYGVTAQANTLGPIAMVLLILELYFPSRAMLRWPILALALTNFVLAQSKTAWLSAVVIVLVSYIPYRFIALKQQPDGYQTAIKILLSVIVGLIGLLAILASLDWDRLLDGGALSLTGRTAIWAATLDEFWRNPFFGYGPDLWGTEFRMRMGKDFVGQAHNQFVHSLGESGLVGFLLLLGYLSAIFVLVIKGFRASRGLTAALFALILVRCVTEAPLRGVVNDWPFFMHATLLLTLIAHASGESAESASAPNADRLGFKRVAA